MYFSKYSNLLSYSLYDMHFCVSHCAIYLCFLFLLDPIAKKVGIDSLGILSLEDMFYLAHTKKSSFKSQ